MRNKIIIIAEAGVNHCGSLILAKRMVDKAKYFKADYIKFQTFEPKLLTVKSSNLAEYQKKNTRFKNQYDMLTSLALKNSDTLKLFKYCKKRKIGFLSTAFDIKSAKFLSNLKMDFAKIPSGEITNYSLIDFVSKKFKKIILSTGASTIDEIKQALKIIKKNKVNKKYIYLLHCNSSYPAPIDELNLNCLITLKKKFNLKVGYSDHSLSKIVPAIAVSKGAQMIEKHFTLNRKLEGPDHKSSILPTEFNELIFNINHTVKALGSSKKKPTKSELKNIKIIRKSIYAYKNIKKGEFFTKNNIIALRPDKGISAINWKKIIGKKSKYNFKQNQLIRIK